MISTRTRPVKPQFILDYPTDICDMFSSLLSCSLLLLYLRPGGADLVSECIFQKHYGSIILGDSSYCSYRRQPLYGVWKLANTDTPTASTGPSHDHTGPHTGSSRGYYAYVDSSNKSPGTRFELSSPIFRNNVNSGGGCVQLWYHMYGSDMGTFNASVFDSRNSTLIAGQTFSGDQGNMWRLMSFPLNLPAGNQHQLQLILEVTTDGQSASDNQGNLAVDDIKIWNSGPCPSVPTTVTPISSQRPTTSAGGMVSTTDPNAPWSCDFNSILSPWCGIQRSSSGGTSFRLTQRTIKGVTSRIGSGYFVHMQGLGVSENATADLNIPRFNQPYICFSFYYHKEGAGVLRVYADVKGAIQEIWSETGTRGNVWVEAHVFLPPESYAVIVEATRGNNSDDILLDDLALSSFQAGCNGLPPGTTITPQSPPTTPAQHTTPAQYTTPRTPPKMAFSCSFDQGFCNLYQEKDDDFNWLRLNTPTWSPSTGPSADHTRGDIRGYYMYIESSYKPDQSVARLSSGLIAMYAGESVCLRLSYHMYGADIGTLTIAVKDPSDNELATRSISGNQGDEWKQADLSFTAPSLVYISISASISHPANKMLFDARGDIAIDDILLTKQNGRCDQLIFDRALSEILVPTTPPPSTSAGPTQPSTASTTRPSLPPVTTTIPPTTTQPSVVSCSFDQYGSCGFQQDSTDDFDWMRLNTRTWSSETGPSFDYTTKNGTGYFMYIEASYKRHDWRARLMSPVLSIQASNSVCLTFYYHMYGRHIATLRVMQRAPGGLEQDVVTFTGDKGDQWLQGQYTVRPMGNSIQIVFEGSIAHNLTGLSEVLGDIAIDDFSLDFNQGCQGLSTDKSMSTTPGDPGSNPPTTQAGSKSSAKTGKTSISSGAPQTNPGGPGSNSPTTQAGSKSSSKTPLGQMGTTGSGGGNNSGIVAAAVVGALVAMIVMLFIGLFVMRRKQMWLFSPGSKLSVRFRRDADGSAGIYNSATNEGYMDSQQYNDVKLSYGKLDDSDA